MPSADTLVSVVLATNRAGLSPFLEASVNSVLAQTHTELELILVDDHSPAPEVLAELSAADPRIRLIRSCRAGVSGARNAGARAARGSLLAFLDDDDVWNAERLAHHVVTMRAEPAAVVSYCRMRTIDAQGKELAPGDQCAIRDIHEVFRRKTGILMPNMVIRHTAFDQTCGFNESLQIAEDLDLLLRLVRIGPVAVVRGDTLVDYRAHTGNTTTQYRAVARSVDDVLRSHRQLARQRGERELAADLTKSIGANNRYAAWSAARVARSALHDRPFTAARELAWAFRFAPTAPASWLRHRVDTLRGHG